MPPAPRRAPPRAADQPAAAVRLRLLGPPQITVDADADHAESRALPNERRTQLVAWLALKRGWVGRPELAALFWPEHDSHLAATNLRKALHRLQTLPWAGGLESQGQALRFAAATDVHGFEAALAEGRTADALALYRGELLQGFDDPANEAWTERLRFERDRLQTAWRTAALDWLARLDSEAGDAGNGSLGSKASDSRDRSTGAAAAVALAARLVAADSLDEAALAAQMRVLARSGQHGAARAAYRGYVDRLAQDLGVEPGAALRALHESLGGAAASTNGAMPTSVATAAASIAAEPSAAPGHRAPPAPSPPADPGFVGRAAELQRIAELLAQDDCAILCLVGPGGVGKTRLAQRAMQRMAAGFADGAVFVAMEDVTSPAEVAPQLAASLGVPLGGRASALDEVRQALAARQMLLVLDNLEQLAANAGWLDDLVRDAPRLKILVTTRVRPVAQRPWTLPVEGLPCPEADDADRLEAFDAARLFVRAAQRVAPSLVPAAEAAAIVDICRQLEGLPLALELAAGFTRVLSCAEIAAELRAGTELLRAADPARPARQASIEAVFEHSWRHLGETERAALARLALFRGGFTAAAARQVAGASPPVLAALADKSLVRKDGARCHLHPLLQQFALARLGVGPAHDQAAAAHARFFLRALAEARGALVAARREAMHDAETEFENLRAAWRHAARHGDVPEAKPAALALLAFCDHRGRWAEGLALFEEALAGPAAAADTPLAATLGAAAAHLEYRLDRYAAAEARARHWLEPARACHEAPAEIQCKKVLAAACLRLGRLPEARTWYQKTLARAEADGDTFTTAGMLDNLSLIERQLGRLDAALDLSRQALARHQALGDAAGEALCLNNQGVLFTQRRELDAAREALVAARQLCLRHGLPTTRAMVEVNLADIAGRQGDLDALERHARSALAISRAGDDRVTELVAHQLLMTAALGRGDLPAARAELVVATRLALASGRPALKVDNVVLYARLLAAHGEHERATQVMRFALEQPSIVGPDREAAEADIRSWTDAAAHGDAAPAWRGPGLDELLARIVQEAASASVANPVRAELVQAQVDHARSR